jgi:catechol 2,3-dioxygenase-like lactoylglutathione lyase family enzyme
MTEDAPYAMAAYTKLLVSDADRSIRFYEALGFELVHRDPLFAHLRWARHADLFLVSTPAGASLDARRGVGVIVCFDARHVALELVLAKAAPFGVGCDGPRDQPWHTRELLLADPDGYRLAFVQPA